MRVTRKIQIRNSQGLHARPASLFVKIANRFESDVIVRKDGEQVSGKSIMGLLTLAANRGSTVQIETNGADAEEAMRALEEFLTGECDDLGIERSGDEGQAK